MITPRLPIALALFVACAAQAADAPPTPSNPVTPGGEITTQVLQPGIALLQSNGGNIAVWHGADGIVLVDDNFAAQVTKVVDAVGRIATGRVRFVINTHWHPDHTGGNETLARDGAVVIAHDNVRARMTEPHYIELVEMLVPAAPAGALPVVTFSDTLTLHLNGDRLDVVHVENAHTDGDAVLWWRRANVVHMGDIYTNGTYPFIDLACGGTLAGLVAASEAVLAAANDTTVIIPGHGAPSNRRELAAWRDMLVAVGRRVRESVEQGRSLDEVLAARPTSDFDERYGRGFMTPERFVRILYRDLAPSGVKSTGRN